jgi:CRP-like cAMP-binding protein
MSKKEDLHVDCEHCSTRFHSVFCHLTKEDLHLVNENKWCQSVHKGQQIFTEGAYPHGIFCINHGKIKVHQMGNEGREQIVRLAKDGDVVGYRSLLSGEAYNCSATALDDTSICFIPKNVFLELVEKNKDLSMQIIQLLSKNLRQAESAILHLAQKSVRERMAEALLFLKEVYGVEEDGVTLTVSLSREEIATLVGTATETAIRLLSEFKTSKMVEFSGKKIKILDQKELLKTANLNE